MINSILLNENDTLVTVITAVTTGSEIYYTMNGVTSKIKAATNIPKYHKAAIKSISKGDEIFKYGERIGYANSDINIGEHVHTNNLNSYKEAIN